MVEIILAILIAPLVGAACYFLLAIIFAAFCYAASLIYSKIDGIDKKL